MVLHALDGDLLGVDHDGVEMLPQRDVHRHVVPTDHPSSPMRPTSAARARRCPGAARARRGTAPSAAPRTRGAARRASSSPGSPLLRAAPSAASPLPRVSTVLPFLIAHFLQLLAQRREIGADLLAARLQRRRRFLRVPRAALQPLLLSAQLLHHLLPIILSLFLSLVPTRVFSSSCRWLSICSRFCLICVCTVARSRRFASFACTRNPACRSNSSFSSAYRAFCASDIATPACVFGTDSARASSVTFMRCRSSSRARSSASSVDCSLRRRAMAASHCRIRALSSIPRRTRTHCGESGPSASRSPAASAGSPR